MYNTLNRRENVCSCNIIRLFYSTLINQSHHQAYSQNNEKHSFQTNIPFRPFLFICLLLIHCMAFDYECILTKRIQTLSLNRRATQKMMYQHTLIFSSYRCHIRVTYMFIWSSHIYSQIQCKILLYSNAISNNNFHERKNVLIFQNTVLCSWGILKSSQMIETAWSLVVIDSLMPKDLFYRTRRQICRAVTMPKTSDGIDNILIYLQDDKLNYRAGTDMVGKVFSFISHVMSKFV